MKFILPGLALAALSLAAPTEQGEISPEAAARICSYGYNYCGSTLLNIGNYENDIKGALNAKKQPTDGDHILYSLFNCNGLISGSIQFLQYCGVGNCTNAGSGNDDHCSA
ncbi:hypothetical protein GRF29_19g855218 [Pseudopithomyces chartarum]|uniref:Uncharacterized protein n=1 Tax=Pseudopithomyces chartarum TaxID=1892770 RepID=A0AAN6M5L5_9PLEO|nr:hypothetical protein GRF29_19g855218 [Pseudopithomyces chartarum]